MPIGLPRWPALLALLLAAEAFALAPVPYAWRHDLPGNYAGWRHGESVAMAGDLLIVGVPFASQSNSGTQYTRNGAVGVHRWRNGRWVAERWLYLTSFGLGLENEARFGASVAVSGEYILIGCPGCTGSRPKAILLEAPPPLLEGPDGTDLVWYPVVPSLSSPHDPDNGIGSAVALAGDIVAIGAPRATFGLLEFGAVQLGRFDGNGVNWEDEFYGWENSRFGQSLAIARTFVNPLINPSHTVVVGAPQYVPQGVFSVAGRVRLLQRSSAGVWNWGQELENPNPGLADGMGIGVAIHRPSASEDAWIAIGSPGRTLNGSPAAGTVRLYRRDDDSGDYELDQEIQHANPVAVDRFGGSVAIVGGRVLVGADGRAVDLNSNAGSVYVFERRFVPALFDFQWLAQQTLFPRSGGNAAFGSAVAMTARAAAIGAPRHDSAGGTVDTGNVATYLCDRIFAHGLQTTTAEACAGP